MSDPIGNWEIARPMYPAKKLWIHKAPRKSFKRTSAIPPFADLPGEGLCPLATPHLGGLQPHPESHFHVTYGTCSSPWLVGADVWGEARAVARRLQPYGRPFFTRYSYL